LSFSRPTLAAIVDRIRTDIEAALPAVDAHVPYTAEEALAIGLGGAAHQLHGHIAYIARQILPTDAEGYWLEAHAAIRGLSRTPATAATGTIPVTGTNDTVIPAGTEWQRADGALYTSDAEATIAGGTADVAATASEPGADSNAIAGTVLSLTSPIAGVDTDATLTGDGMDGGDDRESDEDLRARVLADWATPPHAGGTGDYEAWALAVSGVTRAWEFPAALGPGTVVVLFVRDGDVSPIPSAGEVAEVQAAIDLVKPLTAAVTVAAPVDLPITINVDVTPYTPAVEAAIAAELADLFADESEPGGTIPLSHFNEAISRAAGETDHVLNAPAADVVIDDDEIATIGSLTIGELT